jgi:hypothetical protein
MPSTIALANAEFAELSRAESEARIVGVTAGILIGQSCNRKRGGVR